MTYEEAYKFAVDVATLFIDEEEGVAKNMASSKTVFAQEHPLYCLMAFVYPNLFLKDSRAEYDKIINNEIRTSQMIRIRIACLSVIALTGMEFVDKLTTNIIDGICANSGEKNPRTLRRELVEFFRLRPNAWFCVVASGVFNNRMVANSHAIKKLS